MHFRILYDPAQEKSCLVMRGIIEVPGENLEVILKSIGIQPVSIAALGGAVDNHYTTESPTNWSPIKHIYYSDPDGLNLVNIR